MIELLALGVVAGVIAGMLGVGGGALLVPGFVLFVGFSHVDAEATSLLAIVPTAAVGAWRQHAYGNVRWRDAGLIGVLAIAGAVVGVVIVNAVPERAIELGFAALLVSVACALVRRVMQTEEPAAS